jgi:hypothetical protein
VRLGLDRGHDERDVGLGERVAELLLIAAEKLGELGIPPRAFGRDFGGWREACWAAEQATQ